MNNWEYLRVAVHHRGDGNLDYVAKIEKSLPSMATHDSMEGHFNVEPEKWQIYLQKLANSRWELEKVDAPDRDGNEIYYFRRERE
jgi:hypothetical protein